MRFAIISLCLITLQTAFSQETGRMDYPSKSKELLFPEATSIAPNPDAFSSTSAYLDSFSIAPEVQRNLLNDRGFKALDVRVPLFSFQQLTLKSSLSTYRTFSDYIGLGSNLAVGGLYSYQLLSDLTASAGVSVSRFQLYNDLKTTAGLSAVLRWKISDRFYANANGTYLLNPFQLSRPEMAAFYPQNAYGGNLEFKVNDSWGLQMGAERQFDVFKRKWVTVPYVMPVFYK